VPLHNLERNTQDRESKMFFYESTKCCYTWESSTYVYGHLGGPFIAPREPLTVGSSNGKQSVFPVCVCTGLSGAHRTVTVANFFHFLAKPTVATLRPLGTPDNPVVHRTVRCDLMTVGLADVVVADCAADRWAGVRMAHRTVR
jgi:hypothetical protein